MAVIDKPLTKLQIELIKLFNSEVTDEEVIDIKKLLTNYFAEKASDEMDKLWEANNWSNDTMDEWLKGE